MSSQNRRALAAILLFGSLFLSSTVQASTVITLDKLTDQQSSNDVELPQGRQLLGKVKAVEAVEGDIAAAPVYTPSYGSSPSPKRNRQPGQRAPSPSPSPSPAYGAYGSPSPSPRPTRQPGVRAPSPSPSPDITVAKYTTVCEPAGYFIKAWPVDSLEPYVELATRYKDDGEENADKCEALCVAEPKCKSYYYRIEGKCYLLKAKGRFVGNTYDTVRACYINRL